MVKIRGYWNEKKVLSDENKMYTRTPVININKILHTQKDGHKRKNFQSKPEQK